MNYLSHCKGIVGEKSNKYFHSFSWQLYVISNQQRQQVYTDLDVPPSPE